MNSAAPRTVFVVMVLTGVLILSTNCAYIDRRITEVKDAEVQKLLDRGADWREIERICKDIPQPPGTEFLERRISTKTAKAMHCHFYSKNEFNAIRPLFLRYFRDNGWSS